jgi:NADP-dependent 3-hydroxy acid dehydrogenase YdfG
MPTSSRVTVVTGATGAIGRALSMALAEQGDALWLTAHDHNELLVLSQELSQSGRKIGFVPADLTVEADLEGLVQTVLQEADRLDLLVHAAGVIARGDSEGASLKDLDWQYQINMRAPYRLTQAFLPLLKASAGQVVFINSTAGLSGRPHFGQYCATKHALRGIADSLRQEVNGYGVRVLTVFPGTTAGKMQESLHHAQKKTYAPNRLIQPRDIATMVITAINLPYTVEVTDIIMRPMMNPHAETTHTPTTVS